LASVYGWGKSPGIDDDFCSTAMNRRRLLPDGTTGWGETYGGRPPPRGAGVQFDFLWELNDDRTIRIVGYAETGGAVTIPGVISNGR
jgi:hypothetical protein